MPKWPNFCPIWSLSYDWPNSNLQLLLPKLKSETLENLKSLNWPFSWSKYPHTNAINLTSTFTQSIYSSLFILKFDLIGERYHTRLFSVKFYMWIVKQKIENKPILKYLNLTWQWIKFCCSCSYTIFLIIKTI